MLSFTQLNSNEPSHGKRCILICMAREGSDQPAHLNSLVRTFAVCMRHLPLDIYRANTVGFYKTEQMPKQIWIFSRTTCLKTPFLNVCIKQYSGLILEDIDLYSQSIKAACRQQMQDALRHRLMGVFNGWSCCKLGFHAMKLTHSLLNLSHSPMKEII